MNDLTHAATYALGFAQLLYLVVAIWAALGARRAATTPPAGPGWPLRLAAVAAAPLAMFAAGALLAFPAPKGVWVAAGLLAGGALMALLAAVPRMFPGATPQELAAGRLAAACALLGGVSAFTGLDHDQLVNAHLAVLLGMAAVAAAGWFAPGGSDPVGLAQARGGLGQVLAGAATLAGAVAWGPQALSEHGLGAALPFLLAGVFLLCGQAAAALWPAPETLPQQLGRAFATALLAAAPAYLLLQFGFRAPLHWLAPIGVGLLLPLVWESLTPGAGRREQELDLPWAGLVYVLTGGGAILLANRLGGAYGVGLCGLALLAAAPARRQGWGWVEALLAALAARALVQLYLERTYLARYGVDLTHAYAFAALVLGLSFPLALAVAQGLWRGRLWLGAWGASLALSAPLLVGFFIHIEPVAAFQEGLLAAALLLGFLAGLPDGLLPAWLRDTADALPALLVGTVAAALLSAPWAIEVANSERLLRLELFGLLGAALLLLAWLGSRETPARAGG